LPHSHYKIHVYVSGRTAYLTEPYPLKKLLRYWSYTVPNYRWMMDRFPGWDGKIKLLKRNQLPAGLFWATYREIEKEEHVKFKIHAHHHIGIHRTSERHWVVSEGKYEFQNICVDQMQKAIYKGGGLVLSATGSGKTRVAAMLASRLKCGLLFIVDQLNLLEQARHDIKKHLGENVGKVGESKFNLERVTIATRQTLGEHLRDRKFLEWYTHVPVIIVDELHTQLGKTNFKVINVAKPMVVFGLTATLGLSKKDVRLRSWGLCGPVVYEYPVTRGMKENVLAKGISIRLMYSNHIERD